MYGERTETGIGKIIVVALVTSILTIAAYSMFFQRSTTNQTISQQSVIQKTTQTSSPVKTNTGNVSILPNLFQQSSDKSINVSKSAIPAIVGISNERITNESLFNRGTKVEGFGSGVIVTANGLILTNQHVAGDKGNKSIVSLYGGRNVNGTTIWSDPMLDMAVIKVNETNLKYLPLGDAKNLQVGQPAIAIGNPLGLELQRTVTSGIISALNRTIQIGTGTDQAYMEDLIQTDASINPGNSGGPLLDLEGKVVGINTVKVSSAEGLGFAIPINVAIPVVNRLTKDGVFDEPYMGVYAYDNEVIPFIKNDYNTSDGVVVVKVDTTSPAYRAGINDGTIITKIDGKKVYTMLQLRECIYQKKPGDRINVSRIENGKEKTESLVLSRRTVTTMLTR